ncbi:MAG: heavy-metal-associated domain-containing protein [Planctomycetes bacterium]|nr:heavy-metal-associated domain-containing protein [Planctomycetota bacterium]NOG55342.1 heavy-metal-associated domain-containing protein [Planctomycetota bacterium]
MTTRRTTLGVQGMTCNHCRETVQTILSAMPGVEKASVDLENARAEVVHADTVTGTQMADAVSNAGFEATPESSADADT